MGPEPCVEYLLERRSAANVAPGMGGPGPPLDHDEFLRWRADADSALRGARVQAESGPHNWAYIPSRHPDAHPSGPAGIHYRQSDGASAISDAVEVLGHADAVWEGMSR